MMAEMTIGAVGLASVACAAYACKKLWRVVHTQLLIEDRLKAIEHRARAVSKMEPRPSASLQQGS
jgi:hypothetical protein